MGRIETIIGWAEAQDGWVSDALRRHSIAPQFLLSDEDKLVIEQHVRHSAGFIVAETSELEPIVASHLGAKQNDERQALLASLGPVTNLARLLQYQQLTFALNGITLVYGDNGSGKSGYCRITKKIGRSLSVDDLLGNIFEAGDKPRAKVLVRYLYEGDETATEVDWTDGDPAPDALSGISVFDSRNARLYVDRENRIGFLPAEIAMLERHGVHRKEMDAKFSLERQVLDQRLGIPLPGGFTSGGKVELLIARLRKTSNDLPTAAEIEKEAVWNEVTAAELEALESSVSDDPSVLEERLIRVSAALRLTVGAVSAIGTTLSEEVVSAVLRKVTELDAAAQAVALAAHEAFDGEPLDGSGNEPWRIL